MCKKQTLTPNMIKFAYTLAHCEGPIVKERYQITLPRVLAKNEENMGTLFNFLENSNIRE